MRSFDGRLPGVVEEIIARMSNVFFLTNEENEHAIFPEGKENIGHIVENREIFNSIKTNVFLLNITIFFVTIIFVNNLVSQIQSYFYSQKEKEVLMLMNDPNGVLNQTFENISTRNSEIFRSALFDIIIIAILLIAIRPLSKFIVNRFSYNKEDVLY